MKEEMIAEDGLPSSEEERLALKSGCVCDDCFPSDYLSIKMKSLDAAIYLTKSGSVKDLIKAAKKIEDYFYN